MVQPRKARNYRAEEARRNAKARELGFTSRAQMRGALRKGSFTPIRKSSNPRSPIVGRAAPPAPQPPTVSGAGPGTGRLPSTIRRLRRESQTWSDRHSRLDTSRYDPDWSNDRVRAYHAAFVNDSTRAYRIENGLASLRDFLVDLMGYYTDDEFDGRYGVSSHAFS